MLINVISFNSLTLNSTDYKTVLLNPLATPSAKIAFIEQQESDASDADSYTVDVQNKVLLVKILNWSNRYELIGQLKTAFKRGVKSDLLVNFTDEAVNYVMPCRAVNIVQDPTYLNYFTVTLQTSYTAWRSEDKFSYEWHPTGEDDVGITVGGNDETRLIADMVFTSAPASGYVNQAVYQLPNPLTALGTIPYCITMDTAAIIGDGNMQADCDDLRVVINGNEVRRWIIDPSTDHTKIWFNITLNTGFSLYLKTAITHTNEISTLEFKKPTSYTVRTAIRIPSTGVFYHGTEWFAYNNFDANTFTATVSQRGAFDTTKQTHAVDDVFAYIQNAIILKFGNPEAANPADGDANYDDTKPMISLADSDNTQWLYDATTGFFDPAHPARTAQWKPYIGRSTSLLSGYYSIAENADSGDPVMGMKIIPNATQYGKTMRENAEISWSLANALPVLSKVSAVGQKMMDIGIVGYPSFTAKANRLLGYNPGSVILWTEAAPAADSTYYALSTHEEDVCPGATKNITFSFAASYDYVSGGLGVYGEISEVLLKFTDVFTGEGLLTTKPNITMDLTIINSTNDDSLYANYPLLANKAISIDSELSIVTYDGINFHSSIILNDETRPVFIRLIPGANTIALVGAVGAGTVLLSWYQRRIA